MKVSSGKLDLSDVKTLSIESPDLASGTTIVLGEETRLTISGALTIGDGVIFDLSSWCTYEGFEPYELFTLGTDATFMAPENTFVTIHTSNGDNTQAFLSYDATTNKTRLVPEPTTASLSLLAPAGLAARRRHK